MRATLHEGDVFLWMECTILCAIIAGCFFQRNVGYDNR